MNIEVKESYIPKIFIQWSAIFAIILALISCLGRTTVRNVYYITPKKHRVFIAPPVNYTDNFQLDSRIRKAIAEYFNSRIRFTVVDYAEESDLYVLLYIHTYSQKSVVDYGFGNTELKLITSLFVSDSKYEENIEGDREQVGRYYFKNRSISIGIVDEVNIASTANTAEALEAKGINQLAEIIHSLMETGREQR